MSLNSQNYKFFISHKVVGVVANNKKYEVKLDTQSAPSIMRNMFGLVTPGIIGDIGDILSRCTFANDYQVVEIQKKLFAKHGYNFIKVADRFSCFVSQCHDIGNYSLFRYSECECSLISVLKNENVKVVGEIDDLDDTMIFAL